MKRIWIILTVIANKFINFMSKILVKKEGSVIGGYWVRVFDKNILKRLDLPKIIIGVTGSSGKSSTTELISNLLKMNGYTVAYNKEGSNTINGITSLILSNTSLTGKFKKDVLIMELDEQYMKNIFVYFNPTHLIITNITRDQPPRNTHPEKIFYDIKKAIHPNTHLFLNVDDPYVKRFANFHKGKITTYGMEQNNYSFPNKLHNIDASYCPICGAKLIYEFYHYGHIGNYKCPNGDFERGNVDYLATDINIEKRHISINNKIINLPSNFLYTVYFTTASYALLKELGINDENLKKAFNNEKLKTKRLNIYKLGNREWQMLVSKNENNLSYKQSLDFILHEKGKKTIVLGFDTSSRRYKENDISWIWDIDFELLNEKNIDKIILIGKFKYDLLVRFEYAGINSNKIIVVEDMNNITSVIKKETNGKIYSMVCFDKEIELKEAILKEKHND